MKSISAAELARIVKRLPVSDRRVEAVKIDRPRSSVRLASDVHFRNVDLAGPVIERGLFNPLVIRSCLFESVVFGPAYIKRAVFEDCVFRNCSFGGDHRCIVTESRFAECKFEGVAMENVRLVRCELFATHIVGSLNNVGFESAKIANSKFGGSWGTAPFIESTLKGCSFAGGSFENTLFSECNLTEIEVPDTADSFAIVDRVMAQQVVDEIRIPESARNLVTSIIFDGRDFPVIIGSGTFFALEPEESELARAEMFLAVHRFNALVK